MAVIPHLLAAARGPATPRTPMFISVVIPTYNRLPILRQCLQALERQETGGPLQAYEVVLVDDGSTDDTVRWLDAHATAFPHLRLIRQDHGGPAEGRNRGWTRPGAT